MSCPCGYSQNHENATQCKMCGQALAPASGAGAPSQGTDVRFYSHERQHTLTTLGAPPAPLQPGQPFVLGRADDANLVIPSKRVSRKHCEVFWRSGFPVLRNLSTSGSTLVNGKAVREHELRDGDELTVGPYSCTYHLSGAGGPRKQAVAESEATMASDGMAMSGRLEELNLWQLLRTFETMRRTGTLDIKAGSKGGRIVLKEGKFVSASAEGMENKPAVFEMLTWTEGTFDFSLQQQRTRTLVRKFSYTADVTESFDGTPVGPVLDEAEERGIEEPLATKPKKAPPAPPRPQPKRRPPPRPGARRAPPRG